MSRNYCYCWSLLLALLLVLSQLLLSLLLSVGVVLVLVFVAIFTVFMIIVIVTNVVCWHAGSLSQLDVARFAKKYPAVMTALLRSLLEVTVKYYKALLG